MTNESNFPAVFFEDFLAALRKVQDENRIHGNVEVFELRPSPDGAVHLGVFRRRKQRSSPRRSPGRPTLLPLFRTMAM